MPNALQITDPNADHPLAQAPSWADAAQSVSGTVSSGVDALGQWLAAQRAKNQQDRPPMWSMTNPVGTETTRQPQQLTMPTPGVQPVAFWGGQPVSQQFKDTAHSAIGNALGWVGSAGPGGPIRAFHGSPYDFERFDTSKIGTGEGAQAYGHGLYFAEREGTATGYRDDLSQKSTNPGKMYEVNIGADPEQFLHWDKPISEQSPQVQQALQKAGIPVTQQFSYAGIRSFPTREGADAIAQSQKLNNYTIRQDADRYSIIVPRAGTGADIVAGARDPAAASEMLQKAGIPGIRYLDQGSRGAGEGTHNYVVFDANTIDILRKYGLAGLGVGLSGAAAGTQGQPQ